MGIMHILSLASERLRQLGDFLNRSALLLCVGLAGVNLIVVMVEVISRSSGSTIVWTEELSRWLLIWTTFIGASVVLKARSHVRMEFFLSLFSTKVKKYIDLLANFSVLFFLICFTYTAWVGAVDALRVQGDIIMVPMFYPRLALIVGGGLMMVHEMNTIISSFRSGPGGL